jgi:hypothetical protein
MNARKILRGGFVALMAVLLLSVFLLLLVASLGLGTFFARFDALDAESRRVALGLAEACLNRALLFLAEDPTYVPPVSGACVGVGDTCGATPSKRICRICEVRAQGNDRGIVTRATYGRTFLTVAATATLSDDSIVVTGWRELAANPVPTCIVP